MLLTALLVVCLSVVTCFRLSVSPRMVVMPLRRSITSDAKFTEGQIEQPSAVQSYILEVPEPQCPEPRICIPRSVFDKEREEKARLVHENQELQYRIAQSSSARKEDYVFLKPDGLDMHELRRLNDELRTKVAFLEGRIANLDHRIADLKTESAEFKMDSDQRIADLKTESAEFKMDSDQRIADLKTESAEFKMESDKRILELKACLDKVIQPISARQWAIDADILAMLSIFPDCRRKPFCMRSYKNLLSFLLMPESSEFTSPTAPQAWLAFTPEKRAEIQSKAKTFTANNPKLKCSIDTLKNEAWRLAHTATSVAEVLKYFTLVGDVEACKAVTVCTEFLGTDDEVSETE